MFDNLASYFLTFWSISARRSTLLIVLVSAHSFIAPSIPSKSLFVRHQGVRSRKYSRPDILEKGLQYRAQTVREVFLDKAPGLASLSDIDNNACDAGELLHHRIPFFVVLLYFLIQALLKPGSD